MKAQITIFLAFLGSYIWLLLPNNVFIKPFPFKQSMQITTRTYVAYLMQYVFYAIIVWMVYDQHKTPEMKITAILFVGLVIDFCLNYCDPYGYLSSGSLVKTKPEGFYIPLSYSLVMGICLLILAIIAWIKL